MLSRFEHFSFIISCIDRDIQKLERNEMIKCGYKGSFAQYLITMQRYPSGITMGQLCELCDKDKAAVSRNISEMIEIGLVCRKTEGDKKYGLLLCLTEDGEKAAEFVKKRADTAISYMSNEMTDDERIQFYKNLESIALELEKLTKEGIPDNTL